MQTIVVLLKQTFDTEEKITVTPQGIEERDAKLVINPYDEYALEEALRIKERSGGNVVIVTCGPERAQEAIRTALAVGADEAI
ncbi:electron transfer flavoprotein subunit beta/FixA family protein, partial [Paenibacillus agaridevorans]|uniref:electron transfer flavoprotein subunit beta/FixA family protein n=1 Tax=Paenibacillus agaridevorans TaxID=171404 RepID=UPI00403AC415